MTDYLTDVHNDIQTYFETHEIPSYFLNCFFGELIKVWGVYPLIPDNGYLMDYDDDDHVLLVSEKEYSYEDQISWFLTNEGGTAGWHLAFKEACEQCDMMNLYEYYRLLDWIRSDYFDGFIADKMVKVLFGEGTSSDWYFFKVRKEHSNENN